MKQRLVILGAGESGTGSAILGISKGFDVFVSDKGKIADNYKEELNKWSVPFEESKHSTELILNADLVVKSPGIPDKADLIVALRDKNIPVISEIEFASRYTNAYMVAITGTNGKTTTTSLIYHIFKKAGLNVGLGGNIGKSFARQVALENFDVYVLEISSFQLDGCYDFRANIAVLTNITPDHLDRYDYKLENYIKSKFRITQNQKEEDYFIYHFDDEITTNNLNLIQGKAQILPVSLDHVLESGAFLNDKNIEVHIPQLSKQPFIMPIQEITLRGRHNAVNSMAAALSAYAFNIRKDVIRESLSDFENIEHRLEHVAKIGGIEFINDSKATNVNSTWYALENMEPGTIWIAGGVDKGNDYSILKPLVKEKVKLIICLGVDNRKIHEAFGKDVDLIINTTSMHDAVNISFKMGEKGDTVLLSPACASFDLFENYEDRGRQFKKFVRNL